jgi:hypothetical protein
MSAFSACPVIRYPVERLQGAPARRQRGIDIHGLQEGVDGPGCIAHRDMAMPPFLEQPAEGRVMRFEPFQGGERLRDFFQVAKAHGHHVEDVAILRHFDGQGFGSGERGAELMALEEFADAQNLRLDGGYG